MKTAFTVVMVGALLFGSTTQATVPTKVSYQGQYTENGVLASGDHAFTWRLYNSETGGTLLWTDADTLTVANGVFHAYLGENNPLPPSIFTGQIIWLETDVDGVTIPGRNPLVSVAYSFHAQTADTSLTVPDSHDSGFLARANTANPLIVGASEKVIKMDTEVFDVGGDYDPSIFRFTAPSTGNYMVNWAVNGGRLQTGTSGSGLWNVQVRKNGTPIFATRHLTGTGLHNVQNSGSVFLNLTSGDYLELWHTLTNTSGSPVQTEYKTVVSGVNLTWWSVHRVTD